MAESPVSLVPVRAAELVVGKPLRRAVYDAHGKLLLASGCMIESQSQLSGLLRNGFIRDATWDVAPERPPKESILIASARKTDSSTVTDAGGKDIIADMDDVRWYVGESLYMQVVDNPAVRYTVRLIGFVKGKMVFVTAPTNDGKLEFVREGQTFVVRAFSGKKAYAFVATAVKSFLAPHPYLQLSYPKDVRCTLVRQGARAQVGIAASLVLGAAQNATAATLTDLSVGGASAMVQHPAGAKGDEGKISFKVNAAGQEETLTLKLVVRSVTPAENGEGFKHGFEFLDVPVHDRLILSAYVHQILAEGGA